MRRAAVRTEERMIETASNAWRCYRCSLIFREEWIASLHKEISNHNSYKLVVNKEALLQ
jgi:Zn-finger protein